MVVNWFLNNVVRLCGVIYDDIVDLLEYVNFIIIKVF